MKTARIPISLIIALGAVFCLQMPAHGQLWTWTQCTNGPTGDLWDVASSADGTRLALVIRNGGIYTSINSGATWTLTSAPVRNWWAIASSADGMRLVAAINTLTTGNTGGIYSSADGGNTWHLSGAPSTLLSWQSIASSSNGTNLIATGIGPPTHIGLMYRSSDAGNTWSSVACPRVLQWNGITCSADGTKLIATPYTNAIHTSSDAGATWTTNTLPIPVSFCSWSIAASADGTKLVTGSIAPPIGSIFTSSNSGTAWVSNSPPGGSWYSVAASSNGAILAAVGPGIICTSTNFGQNWVSNSVPPHTWVSVAMSGDASKMVVLGNDGFIYTAQLAAPQLSASLSGTNLTVAWPGSAINYQLQQSFTLSDNLWSNSTYFVTLSNGQYQIITPATNHQTFFRLQSK